MDELTATPGDWFKGPGIDTAGTETTDGLYKALGAAMAAVDPRVRPGCAGGRWVMNLDWYRRIRAMAVTEEQEAARAHSHATLMIPVLPALPIRCPACAGGPFVTVGDLASHAAAMADPVNREPRPGDMLFGIPLDVTPDGGVPHIENKLIPAS